MTVNLYAFALHNTNSQAIPISQTLQTLETFFSVEGSVLGLSSGSGSEKSQKFMKSLKQSLKSGKSVGDSRSSKKNSEVSKCHKKTKNVSEVS